MNIDLSHLSVADMAAIAAVIAAYLQLRSVWLKGRKELTDRMTVLEKRETEVDHRCLALEKEFARLQKHDDRMFTLLDSINSKITSILERLARMES